MCVCGGGGGGKGEGMSGEDVTNFYKPNLDLSNHPTTATDRDLLLLSDCVMSLVGVRLPAPLCHPELTLQQCQVLTR